MRFKKFVFCFVLIAMCSVHVAEGLMRVLKELPNAPFTKALSVVSLSSTVMDSARVGFKKGFDCFKPVAHCVAGSDIVRDIPPERISTALSSRPALVTKTLLTLFVGASTIIELYSGTSKDVWSFRDYVEVGSFCYNIASSSMSFLVDVIGSYYAGIVFRPAFSEGGRINRTARIARFRGRMADIIRKDRTRTVTEKEHYAVLLEVQL
jgi:hypothetical protein